MATNKDKDVVTSHTRRKFLLDMAKTTCGVSLVAVGIGLHSRQANALPSKAIRPPGALAEDEFMSRCVRCGLCARDCPFDILKLSELGEDPPIGTPYYTARTGPCEMCPDIPCVVACPTGALDHDLKDINKSKMGLAVLVDQEECIAFQGLRCEVCFNVCPVSSKAITLEYQHNKRSGKHVNIIPIVHSSDCTGCGKCEQACILEEAAIKVFPLSLAKGQIGAHYRLGWKQKEKAGKSLVTEDPEHKFNLPEDMEYRFNKGGLKKKSDPNKPDNYQSSFNYGAKMNFSGSSKTPYIITNPPTPEPTGLGALNTLKNGFKPAR